MRLRRRRLRHFDSLSTDQLRECVCWRRVLHEWCVQQ